MSCVLTWLALDSVTVLPYIDMLVVTRLECIYRLVEYFHIDQDLWECMDCHWSGWASKGYYYLVYCNHMRWAQVCTILITQSSELITVHMEGPPCMHQYKYIKWLTQYAFSFDWILSIMDMHYLYNSHDWMHWPYLHGESPGLCRMWHDSMAMYWLYIRSHITSM